MILTNIQADVSSALGMTISTTSRVTSVEVLRWINEDYRMAQNELADANISYFQGEIQDLDTEDGVGRYQKPTGFLTIKRLEIQYDDDVDKTRADPIDINDIYSTLDPDSDPWSKLNPFYADWEDDFYIKPVPDETSSLWTIDAGSAMRLWFGEMQDDLSDGSDVPALPSAYHHILAYGPIARGFRKLRKFTEAKIYNDPVTEKGLWEVGLATMIAKNTYKDKTKPMGFTMTRGGSKRNGIWRP